MLVTRARYERDMDYLRASLAEQRANYWELRESLEILRTHLGLLEVKTPAHKTIIERGPKHG